MRVVAIAVLVSALAACGHDGESAKPSPTAKATLPSVSGGTVMTKALTIAHCAHSSTGVWSASGRLHNPTKKKLSVDVIVHVGPPNGSPSTAHVKRVSNIGPDKTVPWAIAVVETNYPAGPCQIQVRVAKK